MKLILFWLAIAVIIAIPARWMWSRRHEMRNVMRITFAGTSWLLVQLVVLAVAILALVVSSDPELEMAGRRFAAIFPLIGLSLARPRNARICI